MKLAKKLRNIGILFIPWAVCAALYCGLILIEGLFFGGEPKTGVWTFVSGVGIMAFAFALYILFPNVKNKPAIVYGTAQLVFLSVGSYLHELEFYYIMMFLFVCMVAISKDFNMVAGYLAFNTAVNIIAIIFLVPRLDWVNNFRFFMEFTLLIFGSALVLAQTYRVSQKETNALRALSAFSSLLGSTPNYMVIIDTEKRVRYISQPMVEFARYSKQEYAIGQPLIDLFSDKALKLMIADVIDADGFVETVFTINGDDGEHHFKVVSNSLSGDMDGMFIDISDITALVKSRKNAEEAQFRAEAANKSKSNFLAAMSHEIRTPINAILGVAQIHLMNSGLPDDYADGLNKIYSSGKTLMGIINDILDLSKIETGKMELNPIEYNVPDMINDTVLLNITRIGDKPVRFILSVDPSLPSKMFGDELRLKQIMSNLLSNAIKYTDSGSVELSVKHSVREDGDIDLCFTVSDTGQGMKPEDKAQLFSEYLRFNAAVNRNTEGTGIGLSITQNLVKMMDGVIGVTSEYGKGSVFTVTVRQSAVKCAKIGVTAADSLNSFTYSAKRERRAQIRNIMPYGRVLIADDVETNLYVAEGLMKPYGLKIETVKSGFEALKKIQDGEVYDIVFMDHMMPEMDGIETTRKIRETGYKGVVIALTANALVGNDEMFRKNGFDSFLAKPIGIRQLDDVLNKFIRSRHPEQARKYGVDGQIAEDGKTSPYEITPRLLKIVRGDAEKALMTLSKAADGGDIKIFITTVHGVKSMSANIGENEISMLAGALENAGQIGDTEFIAANTNRLITKLKVLISRLASEESGNKDDIAADIAEDTEFLIEQLSVIKAACEKYDSQTAYAALGRLKETPCNPQTASEIEEIDLMLLHGDFEEAVNRISVLATNRG